MPVPPMRQPPVIPVKPGDHPAIAHGTPESLHTKDITNPPGDVIRIPKVEGIICGMIDKMAGSFGRWSLPNRLLLRCGENEAAHGSR